jgi:hypothetical protein
MCPVCIITIGSGMLLAKKLGINNVLIIGLITAIFSVTSDIILRKLNGGKVFFNYQRILVSVIIFLVTLLMFITSLL